MLRVPTYFLYGESLAPPGPESLHCESIAARSARHQWLIRPHRHAGFFQMVHLAAGGGQVVLGETAGLVLQPPCVVLIPAGAVHGFRFSLDVEGHVLTVRSERLSAMLVSVPEMSAMLARPRVVRLAVARAEEGAARRCAEHVAGIASEYVSQRPGRLAAMEAQLLAALVLLHRAAGATVADRRPGRVQRLAHAFRDLIDAHYRQHRPLGFYAKRLGVTTTHLNRVAHAVLDRSALGTVHERLLLEARRELTFTVKPVAVIAEELGFRDAPYFTRFFTRAEGVAPRTFRLRAAGR